MEWIHILTNYRLNERRYHLCNKDSRISKTEVYLFWIKLTLKFEIYETKKVNFRKDILA